MMKEILGKAILHIEEKRVFAKSFSERVTHSNLNVSSREMMIKVRTKYLHCD